MKEKYNITGMNCAVCSGHVQKAVSKLIGVKNAKVNLLQNSMSVEYDESKTGKEIIIQAVKKAGYGASLQAYVSQANTVELAETEKTKKQLVWSVIFLIPLLYLSMGHMVGLPELNLLSSHHNFLYFALAQFLLALIIVFINRNYFQRGFKSLINLNPTMDSLIAIGSSAAVIYGIYSIVKIFADNAAAHFDLYFESAGTILTFITIGKFFEARSKVKTNDAVKSLIKLAPKTALLDKGGKVIEIAAEDISVGDILIVKSGSAVPADGVITEGSAFIDESSISGESVPVEKIKSGKVTGATIVKSGYFKMKVLRIGKDTVLSQIIKLVEEAGSSKADIARLADKVSAVFVPVVIVIALAAFAAWLIIGAGIEFAVSIGIAVLVISCPCALGLATPTAIMVSMGVGAKRGILFKNAQSLETARLINAVILDKTGTLTDGKLTVSGIYPYEKTSAKKLLSVAASVESLSEHPLANAVMRKVAKLKISYAKARKFFQIPGRGVKAVVGGKTVLAGNAAFMKDEKIKFKNAADVKGTSLFFAENKVFLGVITFSDSVKRESANAVKKLKSLGLDVVLLTGDNKYSANAAAKQAGIDKVIYGVLPADKEKYVRSLQAENKKVAMVGDGVNDAPALTAADLSIAIGAGTDIAIDSAQVVLIKNDLNDVAAVITLSKATVKNIKQNLFWSFFYNACGIPLATGVFYGVLGWKLNPMFAAAAMSLSSIFVVTNALRLRFFKS
ncbi:heavy metal translocating P-type ATPase [Endomicrobium proavitum]|uniref:P-type Cu(2+) transporter n=1 Tax=Endomicrobium proavitum TaxID=1408281 RepID=A0A0G3WFX7_9BACT|nr:heavy metal translocating P-type ATPase [Endomicrobium proavitum]AKL97521.1 Copper-exporting P-type ATPase A [Endomicrobium proavitum]